MEYQVVRPDWHTWIDRKYIEWRGDGRGSVTEFAAWLGVSQPTVSAWLNKSRQAPKTQKVIDAVANRYPEVYDILEIETDPFYDFLSRDWQNMSLETKKEILRIWREDLEERKDVAGLQQLEAFVAKNPV